MTSPYLQVTFRAGVPRVAYLQLASSGTRAQRTVAVDEDLVVDYAADGSALGIEIIDPGSVTLVGMNALLDSLGVPRMTPQDFAPLNAA